MAVMSFLSLLEPLKDVPRPMAPGPLPNPSPVRTGDSESGTGEEQNNEAVQAEIAQLRASAAEALVEARAAAAELMSDARVQAEAFREAAWQEGFHEGREAGRTATELKLQAEWDARAAALHAQVQETVDAIHAAREELWGMQEAEMVGFVLDVARQVVKTEVTQNADVVQAVLRNALRRVTDKEHVRVRVSVGDADLVRAGREDLMHVLDGVRHLEIVDDRRVSDGGCVVETGAGTIDAKIETQFAEVERALRQAVER